MTEAEIIEVNSIVIHYAGEKTCLTIIVEPKKERVYWEKISGKELEDFIKKFYKWYRKERKSIN